MKELFLIPYLLYCLDSNQDINHDHINEQERAILQDWEKRGYIRFKQHLEITKSFYDFCNEVLFISYIQGTERALQE